MFRYMLPYLSLLPVATVTSAIGYSTGAFDAAGVYAVMFVALLVAGVGAARWEQRRPPGR